MSFFRTAVVTALAWAVGTTVVATCLASSAFGASIQTTQQVSIMSLPSTSATPLGSIPANTNPSYGCFVAAQYVGTVNVWFVATFHGVTGYIPSDEDNSHYASDSDIPADYGVPWCVGEPTYNPQGQNTNPQDPAYYSPQSTSTIPIQGTPITIQGTTPPRIAPQVQAAVNWAIAHDNRNMDQGYCLLFVQQAYAAGGIALGTGGTAAHYWSLNPKHYTEHPKDLNPVYGALVFWSATSSNTAGHVGIYIGNNTVISSSSWPESNSGPIHEFSFSQRNARYTYTGWLLP